MCRRMRGCLAHHKPSKQLLYTRWWSSSGAVSQSLHLLAIGAQPTHVKKPPAECDWIQSLLIYARSHHKQFTLHSPCPSQHESHSLSAFLPARNLTIHTVRGLTQGPLPKTSCVRQPGLSIPLPVSRDPRPISCSSSLPPALLLMAVSAHLIVLLYRLVVQLFPKSNHVTIGDLSVPALTIVCAHRETCYIHLSSKHESPYLCDVTFCPTIKLMWKSRDKPRMGIQCRRPPAWFWL
ncbi:hypothetical protein B0J17DRAFT_449365 [Rhizoctonia solani]|nr:hypothetical protein B0J17DRAFT_449365 [Rhizoctonia solani]